MAAWFMEKKKAIIISIIVALGAALGVPGAALEVVVSAAYDIFQRKSAEKPLVIEVPKVIPVAPVEIKK